MAILRKRVYIVGADVKVSNPPLIPDEIKIANFSFKFSSDRKSLIFTKIKFTKVKFNIKAIIGFDNHVFVHFIVVVRFSFSSLSSLIVF